jgi:DNA polymerase III delta subunit
MPDEKTQNVYWLVGDRYACIERSKGIIKSITNGQEWNIKDIGGLEADFFCSELRKENLFGTENTIFIHDGTIPEPKKTIPFIKKIGQNKVLIVIEETVDRRTIFFKEFESFLEEYPSVVSNNIVNRKIMPQAKNLIKNVVNWKGSDEVFDTIFSVCNYDYGMTINEIEKIITYNEGKDLKFPQQLANILSKSDDAPVYDIVDAIKKKKVNESLKYINELGEDIEDCAMLILSILLEHYTFLSFCLMAVEEGYRNQYDIAEFVSKNYIKNGKEQNIETIDNRLFYFKDELARTSLDKCMLKIKAIENAMDDFILKKGTCKYIFTRLISKIT